MLYSPRINDAIRASARAHEGQYRKGDSPPFITHPIAVALITQKYVDDEDTFIAALLHDVLEDVSEAVYSRQDMYREFGADIVRIVEDVTEPPIIEPNQKAWYERKKGYIDHLAELSDMRALIVAYADKIHNMSEIIRCSKSYDGVIWSIFNADRSRELWFYESIFNVLSQKVLPKDAIDEYADLLKKLKRIR